jgi:hypothetical protein
MGVKLGYLSRREEHTLKVCGYSVPRGISGLMREEIRGTEGKFTRNLIICTPQGKIMT